MHVNNQSKAQFSEVEAARMLGVSVDQLRAMVRDIVKNDGTESSEMAVYQQSDLVLLRILSGMPRAAHIVRA
jgi:hypothetical protein